MTKQSRINSVNFGFFLVSAPDSNFFQLPQKDIETRTPEILNSQEIKSDLNLKIFNFNTIEFYQLLDMFRKFEKITIRWITLFTFRTTGSW